MGRIEENQFVISKQAMDKENLKSDKSVHAFGIGYIYTYLSHEGYTIYEVNTNPDHHFQIVAKRDNEFILVAVRTAYYPDTGTIDKVTKKQLIKESNQLNAIPHLAGLAVTPLKTDDLKIDLLTGGKEYEVTFDGITVV